MEYKVLGNLRKPEEISRNHRKPRNLGKSHENSEKLMGGRGGSKRRELKNIAYGGGIGIQVAVIGAGALSRL